MNFRLIILCMALSISARANAEVLDKFGGCHWPASFGWLGAFAIIMGMFVLFRKRTLAKIVLIISGIYILGAIIWPFLAAHKWVGSWYDKAMFDSFSEIQSCPQFETIGYWQSIWIALILYLLIIAGLLFASRSSK